MATKHLWYGKDYSNDEYEEIIRHNVTECPTFAEKLIYLNKEKDRLTTTYFPDESTRETSKGYLIIIEKILEDVRKNDFPQIIVDEKLKITKAQAVILFSFLKDKGAILSSNNEKLGEFLYPLTGFKPKQIAQDFSKVFSLINENSAIKNKDEDKLTNGQVVVSILEEIITSIKAKSNKL